MTILSTWDSEGWEIISTGFLINLIKICYLKNIYLFKMSKKWKEIKMAYEMRQKCYTYVYTYVLD